MQPSYLGDRWVVWRPDPRGEAHGDRGGPDDCESLPKLPMRGEPGMRGEAMLPPAAGEPARLTSELPKPRGPPGGTARPRMAQ